MALSRLLILGATALFAAAPARATATDAALAVLEASKDPSARVRACVELSTPSAQAPRVYASLAEAMNKDLSDKVRLAAAKAVIAYPGDAPLKRAEAFLRSEPGPQNRIDLIAALAVEPVHLDDTGATNLIIGLLADDITPEVRRAAATGLGRRGDATALYAVRLALDKDADKSVRDAARAAEKILAAPRPIRKAAPFKPVEPKRDAVKGQDPCPEPWGWCQCDAPMRLTPTCRLHKECRIQLDSAIQLGMPCSWNGLQFGAVN